MLAGISKLNLSGATETQDVIKIYEIPERPAYLDNIQNALKVYGCAVRNGENADLDSTLAVVKMVRSLFSDIFCHPISIEHGEMTYVCFPMLNFCCVALLKLYFLQIVRLCQDRYLTTSLDFVDISNILSNIFDGLSK